MTKTAKIGDWTNGQIDKWTNGQMDKWTAAVLIEVAMLRKSAL